MPPTPLPAPQPPPQATRWALWSGVAGLAVVLLGVLFHELNVRRVLSGSASAESVCAGGYWVERAAERVDETMIVPVVDLPGRRLEQVLELPPFQLEACVTLGLQRVRPRAQEAYTDHLRAVRQRATDQFLAKLPEYLTERFSLLNNVMVDLADFANTVGSGVCGCASGCERGGPIKGITAGAAAALDAAGEKREQWMRSLLRDLLNLPVRRHLALTRWRHQP